MKGVALSDLHLGYRAHTAVDRGRNQRELDVEKAWFAAVQKITEIKPDIVTIAGDIVHHPRVSDFAKKAFIGGLSDIARDCGCPIVVLQGNHDAGRTADVLTPIHLPAGIIPGLHVVTKPSRLRLNLGITNVGPWVSVSCFPFVTRELDPKAYKIEPDPEADVNILLMHAAVKGGDVPHFYTGENAIDIGNIKDDWDVIACGDYHEFTMLHGDTCAFYSGAIERTTTNIWQEEAPKGFVEWDIGPDSFNLNFHETPTRPMRDEVFDRSKLTDMDASLSFAHGVNVALAWFMADPGIDDTLLRLKVEDFPREERDHLDWGSVRELKRRCTHFYLDIRYAKREVIEITPRGEGKHRTLADEAIAFFADDELRVRECAFTFLQIEAEVEEVLE